MSISDVKHMVSLRQKRDNMQKLGLESLDPLNYLIRMWKPAKGHRILDDMFNQGTITALLDDDRHPEQVIVNNDHVAYLQDLVWFPTEPELRDLIRSFGTVIQSDAVYFRRQFFKYPTHLGEWCSLIGSLRFLNLSHGGPDFVV